MPTLYVHVPFCIRKCSYCAFYSHSLLKNNNSDRAEDLIEAYLQSLEKEIAIRKKDAPQGVSSLFIGGGTPTALEEEQLERLLIMLKNSFTFTSDTEKTIEGNPGTLTQAKLAILLEHGINRFSLGVQSFNDTLLKRIGRIHSADQARESILLIREAGFINLNLDLMFGLPGQSIAEWDDTLEEAIGYKPEHLSLYALMVEEGTAMAKDENLLKSLPDDDMQAEMYSLACEKLKQAGYFHYETSNFARKGYECRHNLAYWHGQDYIGLGPGAVSYLKGIRWKNLANILEYEDFLNQGREAVDKTEYEVLSERVKMAERLILGLRLSQGIDLWAFKQDFGVDIRDIYAEVLERYQKYGILFIKDGSLRLHPKYWFIANSILQEFV